MSPRRTHPRPARRPSRPPADEPRAPARPRARTSVGQHYLTDGGILRRITALTALGPEEVAIEIGAGPANLTRRLVETGAAVVAIERDRRFEQNLAHLSREFPNLAVAWGDVLDLDWEPLWGGVPAERRVVVGNIPYQITSPILGLLSDRRGRFARALIMMQREVAERLVAEPGTRTRGALGVKLALDFAMRLVLRVPSKAFRPKPQVESAVVEIIPHAAPPVANEVERERVRRVIEAAFGSRRQHLVNTLANHWRPAKPRSEWLTLLGLAGIDATLRAEALPLEAFIALGRALAD